MARQTNNSQSVKMDILTPPFSTGTTPRSTNKKVPVAKKTPAKKTSKSPPKEVKPGTAVTVKRKRGRKNGSDVEEEEQLTGKTYWAKILGPGLYGGEDSDDDDNDEKAPPAKRARTATPPSPEPVTKAGEVFSVHENQPLAAAKPEKAGTSHPTPTPLPTTNPVTLVTPNKHDGGEITFPVHLPTPTSLPRKEATATQTSPEPTPTTATKQVKKLAKPRAPRKPKAEPLVKPKSKAPPKPRAPRKPKVPKELKAAPKPKAPRKPRATKGQGKGKGKEKQPAATTTTTTLPLGIPANAKEVSPGQWEVTLTPEEEAAFLADPAAHGIIVEYDEEVEGRYDPDSPNPSIEGEVEEGPAAAIRLEEVDVDLVDILPAPRRTDVIPNVVEKLRKAKAEFRGEVEEVERIEATWWCKWKDLGESESEDEEDDIIEEKKSGTGRR